MSNSFDIEKVRLDGIVITYASIENKTDIISFDKKQFIRKFTYGFEAGANIEKNKLKVIFKCEMLTEKKSDREPIDISGTFEVAYTFTVKNLSELASLEDSQLKIDNELLISLFNLVYSTSRGVIYTRCQGTIVDDFVLPILPTTKLNELVS